MRAWVQRRRPHARHHNARLDLRLGHRDRQGTARDPSRQEEGCFLALAPDGRTLAIGTGPTPRMPSGSSTSRPARKGSSSARSIRVLARWCSRPTAAGFSGFDRGSGMVWDVRRREAGAGRRSEESAGKEERARGDKTVGCSGFARGWTSPPEGGTPAADDRHRGWSPGFSRSGAGGPWRPLAIAMLLASVGRPGPRGRRQGMTPCPPPLVRIGTDDLRTHGLHHGRSRSRPTAGSSPPGTPTHRVRGSRSSTSAPAGG